MSKCSETLTITMDSHSYPAERGLTILQAAERNGVYIPTLCAHRDLVPFGGCRMCIVEVDGMRGFPTACTTPVEDGMAIRTHTAQLQAMRREVLQLILSEHTSSCLICDEREDCKAYSVTIRKAGVTTGCRYCPNDAQCELQTVTERLGITEIGYPIYYRNLPVETEDPFYDRDYNLCILCGRCVRVCQDIRAAGTLSFCRRGPHTVIGPAFGRSHLEAGCEFCGACVSVCPTGALSEKTGKWDGKPERETVTTCPFCGVGCQMRLLVKNGAVIGSQPSDDVLVNNGQLCVKGRFCVTETVNGYQRATRPYRTESGRTIPIHWEEALAAAAKRLSACAPDDFGMLVSPNCCTEDLYVAQKFVRTVMGSHHIDTSARMFYRAGFNAYLDLMKMSVPLSTVRRASSILCIGLDTRFARSVVGVELRQAVRRGAKIITIHPQDHNLSTFSDRWIQPLPGTETAVLNSLVDLTTARTAGSTLPGGASNGGNHTDDLHTVAQILMDAQPTVILVGSEYLRYDQAASILEAIARLARNTGAGVLPLPAQNNLYGSILMGAYAEFLPGGESATDPKAVSALGQQWNVTIPGFSPWDATMLSPEKRLKVLYLIGEIPSAVERFSDFMIFQSTYPPAVALGADLILPSAAFTEVDGSFINGEGRMQRVRKAVDPPGEAKPDWEILCQIARMMGSKGFDFGSAAEIHREMSRLIDGLGDFDNPAREARSLTCAGEFRIPQTQAAATLKTDRSFPFILSASVVEHTHRGLPLSAHVEGARALFTERIIEINQEDAREAGLSHGDEVLVSGDGFEAAWCARIANDQPRGTLCAVLGEHETIPFNPCPARIRKRDV